MLIAERAKRYLGLKNTALCSPEMINNLSHWSVWKWTNKLPSGFTTERCTGVASNGHESINFLDKILLFTHLYHIHAVQSGTFSSNSSTIRIPFSIKSHNNEYFSNTNLFEVYSSQNFGNFCNMHADASQISVNPSIRLHVFSYEIPAPILRILQLSSPPAKVVLSRTLSSRKREASRIF